MTLRILLLLSLMAASGIGQENLHSLALSHLKSGQPEEALTTLAPLLEENPDAQTYELQGRAMFQLNDMNGALAALDQSIGLEPERSSAHFHVGEIFFRQQRWSEALGAFSYSLELSPDDKAPILKMVYCLVAMENYPVAHKWITTLDPTNDLDPDYYFARASMAMATGKMQEYNNVLRQARTIYSTEVFNRYEPDLLKVVQIIRSREKGSSE